MPKHSFSLFAGGNLFSVRRSCLIQTDSFQFIRWEKSSFEVPIEQVCLREDCLFFPTPITKSRSFELTLKFLATAGLVNERWIYFEISRVTRAIYNHLPKRSIRSLMHNKCESYNME